MFQRGFKPLTRFFLPGRLEWCSITILRHAFHTFAQGQCVGTRRRSLNPQTIKQTLKLQTSLNHKSENPKPWKLWILNQKTLRICSTTGHPQGGRPGKPRGLCERLAMFDDHFPYSSQFPMKSAILGCTTIFGKYPNQCIANLMHTIMILIRSYSYLKNLTKKIKQLEFAGKSPFCTQLSKEVFPKSHTWGCILGMINGQ